MFTKYNRHNNNLYNKLVNLSRNIFFYNKIMLKDSAETRVILIFLHFSIILIKHKSTSKIKFPQKIYDSIFLNIEYHLREEGLGDTSINKKMKNLNKIFYDILLKINNSKNDNFKCNIEVLKKYLTDYLPLNADKFDILSDYFNDFFNFCFDIDNDNMVEGRINFNYNQNGRT